MSRLSSIRTALFLAIAAVSVTACGSGDPGSIPGFPELGVGQAGQQPANSRVIGESCEGKGDTHICLGVKYVSYAEAGISRQQATQLIQAVNRAYAGCDIGFELESYDQVNPADFGLYSGPSAANQTDQIRHAFSTGNQLLLVTTGEWGTQKAAWTNMPPNSVHGAVLEASAGRMPTLIAHELGHYLGLDHVADTANMMNAVVYTDTIYPSQCQTMRAAADQFWRPMYR